MTLAVKGTLFLPCIDHKAEFFFPFVQKPSWTKPTSPSASTAHCLKPSAPRHASAFSSHALAAPSRSDKSTAVQIHEEAPTRGDVPGTASPPPSSCRCAVPPSFPARTRRVQDRWNPCLGSPTWVLHMYNRHRRVVLAVAIHGNLESLLSPIAKSHFYPCIWLWRTYRI